MAYFVWQIAKDILFEMKFMQIFKYKKLWLT